MTTTTNSRSGEKGFTLVELSIVMIIIGLLIGGILKGQELIANARLASAISKVKAIDAAMNTFRDSYAGIPGDVLQSRLPNCTTATKCGVTRNGGTLGDNLIGVTGGTGAAQNANSENIIAWAQLAATDLLGGIRNGLAADTIISGQTIPSAEVPGQIFIGYQNGTAVPDGYVATPIPRAGHYLLIHNGSATGTSVVASGATTASLSPSQASRVDTKLDDGTPNNGSVVAMGEIVNATSTTGCISDAAASATYATAVSGNTCGLYIRVQQ